MLGNAPFSAQFLCVVALIDNLIIYFDINNYSVFTFTMVIIPFGLTRYLMVLAISSTMVSSITSESLITKFAHIFFMLNISLIEQHSSYRLKPFFYINVFVLFINYSKNQSNLLNKTNYTNYAHLNRGSVNLVDMVRPTDPGS